MKASPIVIFGAGGFGREVLQVILDINRAAPSTWDPLGFIVDREFQGAAQVHDLPILGGVEWLVGHSEVNVVIAVGAPAARRHIAQSITRAASVNFASLVHPRAWVGENVTVGAGSVVCAGAMLTTDISIGMHVQVNIGATIGHDALLGDFVTLNPAVNISGRVILSEGVEVGTGSVLLPTMSVGKWAVVGAGSVVTKPVPRDATVVGVPANVIKTRVRGWQG